ncbi:MAG: FkbM family methyltransferase [Verrucomicrobiota bacterium]
MNRFRHAALHGAASLTGWLRLFFARPGFALQLLGRRWSYFTSRRFDGEMPTPDGFLIKTPDALISYWSMFVERELADDAWIDALKSADRPLVVDVGANVGLFSHMVYQLQPQADIVAFEPLPALHQDLMALARRTGMKLDLRAKAAGREPGEALLESPHGYDGVSRICVSGKPAGQTCRVEVSTLDQELAGREILLMKMDVEGYECEVIAGATSVLARTNFLIIEAQTPEHREAITAALGSGWARQKLGSSDYLFSRLSVAGLGP